eukprot:TRINITY_DN502_c0_g2_i1.p1 TRINITY_DN502_c0_g2~~TRINITY_DN502_c0_g2_i1.p1  ORF type:complete len:412 (+),score=121.50 TRINITY_DN502_c0_g2_i1:124-1359(+)
MGNTWSEFGGVWSEMWNRKRNGVQQILHGLKKAPFAIDVGGTLSKLVYVTSHVDDPNEENVPSISARKGSPRPRLQSTPDLEFAGGYDLDITSEAERITYHLHFVRFTKIDELMSFVGKQDSLRLQLEHTKKINATGGGAHKYSSKMQDHFGVGVDKKDEMRTLITGLNFLIKCVQNEVFNYDLETHTQEYIEGPIADPFPYLLVNVGSGTSMIKVIDENTFVRVNGTSIGGATYLGLCRLLTNLSTFEEIHEVEKSGTASNVDLLVGDVYGHSEDHLAHLGLTSDMIASSFGKAAVVPRPDMPDIEVGDEQTITCHNFTPEDITKSLLVMICNTLSQLAFMTAQVHDIKNIYFAGGFLRERSYVWNKLSWGLKFWSKGEMTAHFLLHDGFLGAVGSFVMGNEPTEKPKVE